MRITGRPTLSAARGFSPTDRSRRPLRVRNRYTVSTGTNRSAVSVSRFIVPIASPMNGMSSTSGIVTSGTRETSGGVPWSP